MNTIKILATRDGIAVRTAQRHVSKLRVGRMFGKTIVLNDKEWQAVLDSISSARPGNPNWR